MRLMSLLFSVISVLLLANSVYSQATNRILFGSDRDGTPEIYVMNADGTNPINITNHPAGDGSLAWYPIGVTMTNVESKSWGQIKAEAH